MARGLKTGGRTVGTPNRRTAEVAEKLGALGCDPISGMASIAMDEANSAELRGRMYAELASLYYPKPKAVDMAVDLDAQNLFSEIRRVIVDGPASRETNNG